MTVTTENEQQERALEPAKQQSFFEQHWQKLVALGIWIVLAALFAWYVNSTGKGLAGSVLELIYFIQGSAYGPLIYILVYTLRPLTFFSALILTVTGGFLFGPVWGLVYTIIGANLSATVAYFIGRYFGAGTLDNDGSDSVIQKYANRMRDNSFETVLIMRLIFLPYDLINYMAGFLRIHYWAFILATILGSLPGTISFVLLGASFSVSDVEGLFLRGERPGIDLRPIFASVVIFVVSIAISQYIKRREKNTSNDADPADELSPLATQAASTD